jgi:hypothetical protein
MSLDHRHSHSILKPSVRTLTLGLTSRASQGRIGAKEQLHHHGTKCTPCVFHAWLSLMALQIGILALDQVPTELIASPSASVMGEPQL